MVRVASVGVLVDAQEGSGLSSWKVCHWAVLPKPIPRWDVHFGILKTTERTARILI